jgi:hypothetical protein
MESTSCQRDHKPNGNKMTAHSLFLPEHDQSLCAKNSIGRKLNSLLLSLSSFIRSISALGLWRIRLAQMDRAADTASHR